MMSRFVFRGSSTPPQSNEPGSSSSPRNPNPNSSTSSVGPARPLRLVYCDEKGKFWMDPEAVATLQLVKGPVGIVSICGRARQGKSFVLNQLLGRSSGFQVASTHRPCTKGLWMWSAPIKRLALDGTEYNLVLLDSEGIDAYDQMGTYSTQIFSLAVLLSSMFIYNQMGGIDEAALDRLSLVTEMTKHIHVRASSGRTSASELGQFSPVFVWLLRDFYLDLVEENRRITPRDYLELALQPMQGGVRDISAKNESRQSIRALFPDREYFTLARPLNNENDLQCLDQISLDRLRPEFRSGLDALTKFVFEMTKPKQVGATVMTGPILAGITQSFLDAINNGAVPTISSSWQSVEEAECRRAYDSATEAYTSSFDRTKPADEAVLREIHEVAVRKALAVFNSSAVGAGGARLNYEKLLHNFFKMAFEAAESKLQNHDFETQADEIKNISGKLEFADSKSQSCEKEVRILEQEKIHLQEKYLLECKKFDEADKMCKDAERDAKRAFELPDTARAEAAAAQKEKNEAQRLAMERLTQIERAERKVESLEGERYKLVEEAERLRLSEMEAVSKVSLLETRVDERGREIKETLNQNNEQRSSTVQVLESRENNENGSEDHRMLATERAALAEANSRAEALSLQLQATQGKLDALQQVLTSVRLDETALDSKLKLFRMDEFVHDMDHEDERRGGKRSSTTSPLKYNQSEDGGSVYRDEEDRNESQENNENGSEDYRMLTVFQLKQELTKQGFGGHLLQLRNPLKKDILVLYEKHVLKK